MSRRYILAIGRSRVGIRHDGAMDDERVHLIVMLIAGEKARDYLQVLASIARQVKERALVDNLVNASDLDSLYELLVGGFGGIRPVQAQQNRVNRLMFREAERVAKGAACGAIMVFGDTFIGGIDRGRDRVEDQNHPGHAQSYRADRRRARVRRDDPSAFVFQPADGAVAERDPRGAHARRHQVHRSHLLHRRHDGEQPVRHVGGGRYRA